MPTPPRLAPHTVPRAIAAAIAALACHAAAAMPMRPSAHNLTASFAAVVRSTSADSLSLSGKRIRPSGDITADIRFDPSWTVADTRAHGWGRAFPDGVAGMDWSQTLGDVARDDAGGDDPQTLSPASGDFLLAAVPEPSTRGLIWAGIALVAWLARRRENWLRPDEARLAGKPGSLAPA